MNKEGKRGRTREREGRKADVGKREEEEQSRGEAEHGPEASVFTSSPGPRWAAIGAGAAAALGVAFDATLGICPVWMGRRGRKGSVPLLINLLLQPAGLSASPDQSPPAASSSHGSNPVLPLLPPRTVFSLPPIHKDENAFHPSQHKADS